jgi:hypothetical protein
MVVTTPVITNPRKRKIRSRRESVFEAVKEEEAPQSGFILPERVKWSNGSFEGRVNRKLGENILLCAGVPVIRRMQRHSASCRFFDTMVSELGSCTASMARGIASLTQMTGVFKWPLFDN